jgi:uncharacterized membrane protein YjjP (DUF1212 family)
LLAHTRQAVSNKGNSIEEIATVALEFGRLLMENGARARQVEDLVIQVASGLGVRCTSLRIGYASLAITVNTEAGTITRIRKIGPLGVNQSLYHALCTSVARIVQGGYTADQAHTELDNLVRASRKHSDFVVAVAVGFACAAFGRLLGVEWVALGPIFAASAVGQMVRQWLPRRNVNVILSTAVVAFVGSYLGGLGARFVGSQTVGRDMVATVLALVPGAAAFNAQFDIFEGWPTLGSARAVWVLVTLVFMTAGVWIARGLLGEGR